MSDNRYTRNEGLFGKDGQRLIGDTIVAIIGYGGLGSVVGLLLAYLGVTRFRIVEFDPVEQSNLNRLVGATPSDVGEAKAFIAERTLRAIQPDGDIRVAGVPFSDDKAKALIDDAHVVFGCVDREPARVEILDWAAQHRAPYIDAATDVVPQEDGTMIYGGRVVVTTGKGCPVCLDVLDQQELAVANMTPDQRAAHAQIYGIDVDALDESGPSVVSINAVVASLAVTEFMALVTGLRPPNQALTYRADRGGVVVDRTEPKPGCFYCSQYHTATS
jgi:hypothetical protein